MTPDEWKRTMFYEIDDFINYWWGHLHLCHKQYRRNMQFDEWLKEFTKFQEDKQ